MRITIVSETYFPQINGVSRTLDHLVKHLVACGDSVQLVVPRYRPNVYDTPYQLKKSEWPAFKLPFYKEIFLSFGSPARISSDIQKFAPQIMHIATEGPLGLSSLISSKKLKIPTVSSYHTNFAQYFRFYRAGMLEPAVWRYLRWFHNKTRKTFCPTPSIQSILAQRGFQNISIWGRGVDAELFSPARRNEALRHHLGIEPSEIVLAYAGRLAAEKNLEMLIDAWRRTLGLSKQRLLLIGDGPLRQKLEKLGDDRIIITGYRQGKDLARIYAMADLFVFPSLTDTFGNVVLEAMASGLPVVAFDVPGPRDIILPGKTGELVEDASAQALREILSALLCCPEKIRKMGAAAREYALQKSWKIINNDLRNNYLNIIQ